MTILELAKELKVSKQAVRRYITPDFREKYIENVYGRLQIREEGCKLLRERFQSQSGNNREQAETVTGNNQEQVGTVTGNNREQAGTVTGNLSETGVFAETLAVLKSQLEVKDEQLAEKDRQIEALQTALTETTSALQAAQALHAGTLQHQLEKPKKGLFRWLGKKVRNDD